MKFDQVMDSQSDSISSPINTVFPDKNRLIFIAGSTHPGEEVIMVKTFKSLVVDFPSLNFILAPRHAERTYDVEKILKKEDMDYVLLTELKESLKNVNSAISKEIINQGKAKRKVLLVNTTGDLMGLFAVSDIVFMGKSLCGVKGGHNIIEPAIYGKPVIFGSNMDNFRQVVKIFKDNKAAVEVKNEQEFCRTLRRLLSDPAERECLSRISREVVEKNRGAINKTIDLLRGNND
jgi:3-deoxy-D-manno-octulosonic-acid transferase